MKLVIEHTDLLKAVDPAAKVIQRRNIIPILNNIRIAAEGSQIAVTATDLEIEIRTMAPADVEVAGTITVPADHLLDLIRRMPDGSQISFELEPDTRLSMRRGRSHTRLPTLPVGDYPDIAPGDMTHRFDMPADVITSILRDTVFAASNEPTLHRICGVHWHQVETENGSRLAAVATDGSRMLARRVTPLPEGNGSEVAVHDLKIYPDSLALLQQIPKDRRIGPVVFDEGSRQPYRNRQFKVKFREIANKSGWPADVCNMDSRAGAVSEAFEAGA